MYKPVPAIEVRIWGKKVGAVALDPKLGYYAFEYDPRFVASGIKLAPLTMPLAKAREPFVFADLPELTFKRLPAMLADALPDEFGNSLIDAWMAGRGVAKSQITPLDRLDYMGKMGTGALEEGFRRMAFNIMAANCDDHTKNVSFILREGKQRESPSIST